MNGSPKLKLIPLASGLALLVVWLLPPARHALESSMSLHMLVHYPGLMLAGALLTAAVPRGKRGRLAAWRAPRAGRMPTRACCRGTRPSPSIAA